MSKSHPLDDIVANNFLSRNSFFGLFSIFALKLSLEKNTAFSRIDLPKTFGVSADYFHGYIVALYSIEILDFNFKNEIYTITYLDPAISRLIENSINQVIKTKSNGAVWQERLDKLKGYF